MVDRDHQVSPERTIDTPFGPMIAVVTGYDHIYLKPAVRGFDLRVNRVAVYATMRLCNYHDGKGFVPDQGKDKKDGGPWTSVYTRREGTGEVSIAAQSKLWTTLPGLVNDWLIGKEELLKDARRVELSNAILRKQDAIRELLDKSNDLSNELEDLYEAEREL